MHGRHSVSFFDQDHSADSNIRYHKRKASVMSEAHPSKTYGHAPPRPVSPTTKAKLGAFAFKRDHGGSFDDEELENEDEILTRNDITSPTKVLLRSDIPMDYPKTPVSRLSTKDFVGDMDSTRLTLFGKGSHVSTEERITWRVSPRATPAPTTHVTPGRKRARQKRARSSSPVGSPLRKQLSRHQNDVDTENRTPPCPDTLKTPLSDPANDLWRRYSNRNNIVNQPNNHHNDPIGKLFGPNITNQLNLSPLGLRRSYSCGPNWPPTDLEAFSLSSSDEGDDQYLHPTKQICSHKDKACASIENSRKYNECNCSSTNTNTSRIIAEEDDDNISRLKRLNRLIHKVHRELGTDDLSTESSSISRMMTTKTNQGGDAGSNRGSKCSEPIPEAIKPIPTYCSDYDDDFGSEVDLETLDKVEEVAAAFVRKQGPSGSTAVECSTLTEINDNREDYFESDAELFDNIDVDLLVSDFTRVAEAQENSSELHVSSSTKKRKKGV